MVRLLPHLQMDPSTSIQRSNEMDHKEVEERDSKNVSTVVSKNAEPKHPHKTRHLVTKRKRNVGKKIYVSGSAVQANVKASSRIGLGLPTFHRHNATPSSAKSSDEKQPCNNVNDDASSPSSFQSEDEMDIMSETLVAIHSLLQADKGLPIPLANNIVIQAVLENQIYSIFDQNAATSVHRELLELVQSNRIRQLYCQDKKTSAFVVTDDFVRAVWDAVNSSNQDRRDHLVSWFVSNFDKWTGRTVSKSSMEIQWEEFEKRKSQNSDFIEEGRLIGSFQKAVQELMDQQLLIRDTGTFNNYQESFYYFWIPQWGVTLKEWNKARQQLLNVLAQRKSISKMNLLRQNRHSYISTQFLLDELIYEDRVHVIERPFGSFVQLVKEGM